jgi:hypothetical protein
MSVFSKTMSSLRWLREGFEGIAPIVAAVSPKVGLLLLVIAAGFAAHSWNFARGKVRAEATIAENVAGFAKGGGVVYTPRFRFRTPRGELVTVLNSSGNEEAEFAAGDTVPVLYRAGDPQGAIIATVWLAYQGAIICGVLGTALFDLGWALRVMLRRREAASV